MLADWITRIQQLSSDHRYAKTHYWKEIAFVSLLFSSNMRKQVIRYLDVFLCAVWQQKQP